MRSHRKGGYTLIELIIALLLFVAGGLALASTGGLIGRQLNVDGARERAGRIAASRLEMLRANCRQAARGRETIGGIESAWSVSQEASRINVVASVSYASWNGLRTDSYRASIACP